MILILTTADNKRHSLQNFNIEIVEGKTYAFEELSEYSNLGGGSIMPQDVPNFEGKTFAKTTYPQGTPTHPNFLKSRVYLKENTI